ncbi:MAG TPA: hypothetical protein VNJ03_08715 [Vicinamibacterales bacterium]|nr:hypothetical protein [Vicinamibacterales bacterium]
MVYRSDSLNFPRSEAVSFEFAGDRNYVQGSDLYLCAAEHAQRLLPTPLDSAAAFAAFYRLTDRFATMVVHDGVAAPRLDGAFAIMRFWDGSRSFWFRFIEGELAVTGRYPYDENRIDGVVENGKIRGSSEYPPIKTLVSLTKKLHQSTLPDAAGRWLFTRLELQRALPMKGAGPLEVQLVSNWNNRITKSTVSADGAPIGSIGFSLVPA